MIQLKMYIGLIKSTKMYFLHKYLIYPLKTFANIVLSL